MCVLGETFQTRIGDVRAPREIQRMHLSHSSEMGKAGIGDLTPAEIQKMHLSHFSEMEQAGIGDLAAPIEIQRLHLSHTS
jgi:hypothetical protein